MQARVHRIPASAPDDVSGLQGLFAAGLLDPSRVVAVLGKTEGNGCVNDFTRGYATHSLKAALAAATGSTAEAVGEAAVFVMSGGTEGGLSPHFLVFEAIPAATPPQAGHKALAFGRAVTRPFAPHEIGRAPQVDETVTAVRAAMRDAGIEDVADVHYVQVKCPLLTKARIAEAQAAGHDVVTGDTLKSMAFSRAVSALGVGVALGEIDRAAVHDAMVCSDYSVYSSVASTSSGLELMENQVLVVGNSAAWSGDLVVGHALMQDAIDLDAVVELVSGLGLPPTLPLSRASQTQVLAVLAKADPGQSGVIRGARHTMLDDSDIASSRHVRALVGGVLAGVFGTTLLFVSGGAEHQGPDGGGPVAIIVRRAD